MPSFLSLVSKRIVWERTSKARPESKGARAERFRAAFASLRARGAREASFSASALVAPANSSRVTTRLTSPKARACSASTGSAVRIRSLARPSPTSLGSRWVPPAPGRIPSPTSGNPSFDPATAMRKSQASASSIPPPRACPFIEAMVGLGLLSMRAKRWLRHASSTCFDLRCCRSRRSAPETKTLSPPPVKTITTTSRFCSQSSRARSISAAVASSKALRTSGRSMVMVAIRSCTLKPMFMNATARPREVSAPSGGEEDFSENLALFQKPVGLGSLGQREHPIHYGLQPARLQVAEYGGEMGAASHGGSQDGEVLEEYVAQVQLHVGAAGGAAGDQSASPGKTAQSQREHGLPHVLDHHVGATAGGEPFHFLGQIGARQVDPILRSEILRFVQLLLAAGDGDDPGAVQAGYLDGRRAHAASCAEHH